MKSRPIARSKRFGTRRGFERGPGTVADRCGTARCSGSGAWSPEAAETSACGLMTAIFSSRPRNVRCARWQRTIWSAPTGAGEPRTRPGSRPTSELPLHLAAYAARPEIRAVIHTHPTFCVVWSKTGAIFERDTVGARETLGEVAWTPYAPPGSAGTRAADLRAVRTRRQLRS